MLTLDILNNRTLYTAVPDVPWAASPIHLAKVKFHEGVTARIYWHYLQYLRDSTGRVEHRVQLRRAGLVLGCDDVQASIGCDGRKSATTRLREYAGEVQAHSVEDALLEQIYEHKTEHYRKAIRPGQVSIRPGVRRLIDAEKTSGITLFFVTTTESRNLKTIDYALGEEFTLSDFDLILDRDMVKAEKPAPETYQLVLDALDVRACDALAIEDTSECVASEVTAGVSSIATPHSFSVNQNFSKAVVCLDHLGDLATLILGRQVTDEGVVTVESIGTVIGTLVTDNGDTRIR